ncbi:MAG: NlpC/P60 family protein [Halobacteriota archaeon]|nr:NlpC/P60 family protein [Halobacteriota archaeon]
MKTYFDGNLITEWRLDAIDRQPEESCGLFVQYENNPIEFLSLPNIAEDREKTFEIDPVLFYKIEKQYQIKAVLHSHTDYPHASKKDMITQQNMNIPWGIINFHKGAPREVFFFGEQLPIQDLVGRPFYHGVYDCYGVIRDFYRMCGITMIDHPRGFRWWNLKGPNLLLDHYKDNGFDKVDEKSIQPGDVVFMTIGGRQVNHAAVYIGENIILHHLVNRLSRREPYTNWKRRSNFIVRHKDAQKNSFIWELSTNLRRGVQP